MYKVCVIALATIVFFAEISFAWVQTQNKAGNGYFWQGGQAVIVPQLRGFNDLQTLNNNRAVTNCTRRMEFSRGTIFISFAVDLCCRYPTKLRKVRWG